jgi:hypothetical protein
VELNGNEWLVEEAAWDHYQRFCEVIYLLEVRREQINDHSRRQWGHIEQINIVRSTDCIVR